MKAIRKQIKDIVGRIRLFMFLNTSSESNLKAILIDQHNDLDIITIAFNNAMAIQYQIQLIKKYVKDSHTHIVADNSTAYVVRKEIMTMCSQLGVMYISIPVNKYKSNKSHGAAMHWVYKNVIRKRNRPYFGFIDHDIFPMQSCTILNKYKNNIYGRVTPAYTKDHKSVVPFSNEQPYWSLWAGLFFLKTDLLKSFNVYALNFFPRPLNNGTYLDTGGGLWDTIFKRIPNPEKIVEFSSVKFRDSAGGNYKTDYYECLDEWIHIINLSNNYKTHDIEGKISFLEDMLKQALMK